MLDPVTAAYCDHFLKSSKYNVRLHTFMPPLTCKCHCGLELSLKNHPMDIFLWIFDQPFPSLVCLFRSGSIREPSCCATFPLLTVVCGWLCWTFSSLKMQAGSPVRASKVTHKSWQFITGSTAALFLVCFQHTASLKHPRCSRSEQSERARIALKGVNVLIKNDLWEGMETTGGFSFSLL